MSRLTPDTFDVLLPSGALSKPILAVVTKRGKYQNLEILEIPTRKLIPVTDSTTDHWNPAISRDGKRILFHKSPEILKNIPHIMEWPSPFPEQIRLLRVHGQFPAYSQDFTQIGFNRGFQQLCVMQSDGSNFNSIYQGGSFHVSWANSTIVFSHGPTFSDPSTPVNLALIQSDGSNFRELTKDCGNNAFGSFSPDGKEIIFRSGRSGYKNLYIISVGNNKVRQLTKGPWTDTMVLKNFFFNILTNLLQPHWSPLGDWIAFSSDRDKTGNFAIWMIKPDGTGLHKVFDEGTLNNHPWISQDGTFIVFTSDYAGYSTEEISMPFQFQPYGKDIYSE